MSKKTSLFYRILVFGIILLFVCMNITPSMAIDNLNKFSTPFSISDILYVGGSGPGNYTKIQDAINDATYGDTVFVFNGTYYENLVVNKTINLIGENRNNTIIDGSNIVDTINITVNGVTISEFTIQHGNEIAIIINSADNIIKNNLITLNGYGIWIWGYYHNNTITGNNISFNYLGLQFYKSSYNIMTNNIITSQENRGIFLLESSYNNISSNNISKCGMGIASQGGSSYNNYFYNDIWMNNNIGIYCIHANFNNFCNNTIRFNNDVGLKLSDMCYNNTIKGNIIDSNMNYGIRLGYTYNSIIIENTVKNTSHNTPQQGIGIYVFDMAENNYIYHNNIFKNSHNNAEDDSYEDHGNFWDNGYPSGGNYWGDYFGIDLDRDGIGDYPYYFHLDKEDRYPLMKPFGKKSADFIPRYRQNVFFQFLEMFPWLEKLLQIHSQNSF
jgi:nitrous oxidase accessory protein